MRPQGLKPDIDIFESCSNLFSFINRKFVADISTEKQTTKSETARALYITFLTRKSMDFHFSTRYHGLNLYSSVFQSYAIVIKGLKVVFVSNRKNHKEEYYNICLRFIITIGKKSNLCPTSSVGRA